MQSAQTMEGGMYLWVFLFCQQLICLVSPQATADEQN